MVSKDSKLVIGIARIRRKDEPFGVSTDDRLHHMLLVGKTGTGKSTLINNFVRQDAESGRSFCLIDPHGDLASAASSHNSDAYFYWDIGDPACELGYNPVRQVPQTLRAAVVSGLIDALKKQWSDSWGVRMEHLLRYALLALVERHDSTLRDVVPLFIDKERRSMVVAEIQDPQVRSFWEFEFPAINYRTSSDGVSSIANKVGAFLSHPLVRRSLCDPKKPIDFSDLLRTGKSLVINLSKGTIGSDAANVVGGLILSAFAAAAYERQARAPEERSPYFLYVDEFHSFTTEAFADMLSELRKYGIGIVASTQHTAQISVANRESVLGNVGTIIAFRLGAADALLFAREFGDEKFQPSDLAGLANFEMYVRTIVNGVQLRAFSARTLPA